MHLPGAVLVAEAGPFGEDLPAGADGGGTPCDEALGDGPAVLGQAAGLRAVAALEVGQLALGQPRQHRLGHPLVVRV